MNLRKISTRTKNYTNSVSRKAVIWGLTSDYELHDITHSRNGALHKVRKIAKKKYPWEKYLPLSRDTWHKVNMSWDRYTMKFKPTLVKHERISVYPSVWFIFKSSTMRNVRNILIQSTRRAMSALTSRQGWCLRCR